MKLIKIMWKLSLAFVAAGYGNYEYGRFVSRAGDTACTRVAPGHSLGLPCGASIDREASLLIYGMMLDGFPDNEIMKAINTLKEHIAATQIPEDKTECALNRRELSKHLDDISANLLLHKRIMKLIAHIAHDQLFEHQNRYHKELRAIIKCTVDFPVYKEDADRFKKSLVTQQMTTIEYMMLGSETEEEIKQAIQELMDFIQEKDDLEFQGKLELLTLKNIMAGLDLHREMYAERRRLLSLIRNIVLNEDKEEAERTVERVKVDLEAWKRSAEGFGEQYTEALKELEKILGCL